MQVIPLSRFLAQAAQAERLAVASHAAAHAVGAVVTHDEITFESAAQHAAYLAELQRPQ